VRNFHILIVSAVKIWCGSSSFSAHGKIGNFIIIIIIIIKECLQTASVSGTLSPCRPSTGPLPPDLPWLRSWTPLGDLRPQTPGLWPHIKIPGATIPPSLGRHVSVDNWPLYAADSDRSTAAVTDTERQPKSHVVRR